MSSLIELPPLPKIALLSNHFNTLRIAHFGEAVGSSGDGGDIAGAARAGGAGGAGAVAIGVIAICIRAPHAAGRSKPPGIVTKAIKQSDQTRATGLSGRQVNLNGR